MTDREEKIRLISKRMRDIESLWRTIEKQNEPETIQEEEQDHHENDESWTTQPEESQEVSTGSCSSWKKDGSFGEHTSQTSNETPSEGRNHSFHPRQSLWKIWSPLSETNINDDEKHSEDYELDYETEIVRDTRYMIDQKFPDLKHKPTIIEDNFGEEDYYKALPEDTFSLMILGEPLSKQWIYGMIAFGLQTSLLFVIAAEFYVTSKESTPLNVPYKVDRVVLLGQILALFLSLWTQIDLILAISTFILLGFRKKQNWTSLIKAPLNSTFSTWIVRIAFPVSCEFLEGFLVLATTFCIVVQSDSVSFFVL
jgi:hypothetical protein